MDSTKYSKTKPKEIPWTYEQAQNAFRRPNLAAAWRGTLSKKNKTPAASSAPSK